MSRTTTARGRRQVATPDLLYDTLDGGTDLHNAVNAIFTAFSDDLMWRYVSVTLANGASTTITHNFGLALAKMRYIVFEGGAQRTAAQVAADYGVAESGGSSTTAIVVTNNSGGSKTLLFCLFAGRYGITQEDFDAACSIDTTGNVRAAEVRTTGDDLVLNHDATGAGADHTATLRRPSSGMSGAAVHTLPSATSTLATLALAETLANKTLTASPGISLNASAAIDWAAGNASLGASIGANTLTVAGATSTVYMPGTLRGGTLETLSDDLVLNQDAAGAGADWKATIRRPSSGMTGHAVHTLPATTTTLLGTDTAQVVTGKDYQSGTASDTERLRLPRDTKANLDALTHQAGLLAYATDLATVMANNGSAWVPIGGGGGGGGSAAWNAPAGSGAILSEEAGERIYLFPDAADNKLVLFLKVPASYVAGNQIRMRGLFYSPTAGTLTLKPLTTAYLVRPGTDAVDSVATSRPSTNAAFTVNATPNVPTEVVFDLTAADGTLGGTAVAAGDLIRVELTRDHANDDDTADARFIPSATEVSFS